MSGMLNSKDDKITVDAKLVVAPGENCFTSLFWCPEV
jgi:hypothetical protein